jgi:hypothetical protein
MRIAQVMIGLLLGCIAQAQESTNSSGGDAKGSGGTVAYSLGQIAYSTYIESSGTAAQGVQHAYEIFKVGTSEIEQSISIKSFPNPCAENLTLEISNYNQEKLFYQLYNTQGGLLFEGQITDNKTFIKMDAYAAETFLVNIVNSENNKVQAFKIVKK